MFVADSYFRVIDRSVRRVGELNHDRFGSLFGWVRSERHSHGQRLSGQPQERRGSKSPNEDGSCECERLHAVFVILSIIVVIIKMVLARSRRRRSEGRRVSLDNEQRRAERLHERSQVRQARPTFPT